MDCPFCKKPMKTGGQASIEMSGGLLLPCLRWLCENEACDEVVCIVPTGEPEKVPEWLKKSS